MSETVIEIAARSVLISGAATLLASTWSLPAAIVLAERRTLPRIVLPVLESMVGMPTVLVGLLLYLTFSSSGPLGFLGLLYTPQAIIIGQSILVTPLMISVSYRVLSAASRTYGELAETLGATLWERRVLVFYQSAAGLVGAVVMSFSRAVGELGVALMVGGNISGYTRVMTTAIALEVSKGNYEIAVSLGLILLAISSSISVIIRLLGITRVENGT
ncbi:MAG: ABC transporter permease [Desulfurococcales archaeon]|nr:ABC transporter permease [Desulfurococcales archaeon]